MTTADKLSITDVAVLIGVSVSAVGSYRARGILPAADGIDGRSPWWRATTIETWHSRRPGMGVGGGRRPVPPEDRFWPKVDKTDACWLWHGMLDDCGYGVFRVSREKITRAHRFAYTLMVGPIPEGTELDHLCSVRNCVRPDHLEPVPHEVNVRRGRGGEHWAAKTHCPRGHAYTEDNTYVYDGRRHCRECRSYKNRRAREVQ